LTRDDGIAIDSALTIYEADGTTVVPYYGSATGAFNEGGFQDSDAVLIDLTMPYTGTYYVKVSTFSVTDSFGILHNSELGNYELFMYSFAATTPGGTTPSGTTAFGATPPANGSTLVGGSGEDTLMGSSADDLIEVVPGDSVIAGSGASTIDTLPYNITITDPPPQVENPLLLSGSFVASNSSMPYTYDWHVASSNGQVIADGRGTAAINGGVGTTAFQFLPSTVGVYTITLTITDGFGGVNQATLPVTLGTITPLTTQIGTGAGELAGTIDTPITLTATPTGSYPVTSYTWVVATPTGVTAPASGSSFTFTPTSAGDYSVNMTATDTAGNLSVSTVTVIVPYVAPSAQIIGVPAYEYVPEGSPFSLASIVNNPTPTNALTESWTVTAGDGSEAPYTVTTPDVTCTPDDIGSYTVTLNLLNASGQVVSSASQQIISIGVAPTATISVGPSGGATTKGTTVALGGTVTNPSAVLQSAGFSESWTIEFGGATYGPYYGPALNVTLGSVGIYTVALTATDAEGVSSTTTQTLTAVDTATVSMPGSGVNAVVYPTGTVTFSPWSPRPLHRSAAKASHSRPR